jgi:hypothetical protein
VQNVLDEMADSMIMIEQVRQLYNISEFDLRRRIDFKLNRQLDRISKEAEEM